MTSIKTILENGTIEFRNENGELHNDDGAAVIYANGAVEYWLDGEEYEYWQWEAGVLTSEDIDKMVRAGLCVRGELHRLDGPAIEVKAKGSDELDGPTIVRDN